MSDETEESYDGSKDHLPDGSHASRDQVDRRRQSDVLAARNAADNPGRVRRANDPIVAPDASSIRRATKRG